MRAVPGRPWRWFAIAALGSAAALVACSTVSDLPKSFGKLWQEYREMPDERAMAVSGDLEGLWVAGATGGHRTRLAASEEALAECERRRRVRRVAAPCHLYAVGDRRILVD